MLGIAELGTYIIATVIIILLPGPNSMFCMTVAGRYGSRVARRAIAGTFLGNAILMLASALGMGALLTQYPVVFTALKIVGASYLAYIALKLLKAAWIHWHSQTQQQSSSFDNSSDNPLGNAKPADDADGQNSISSQGVFKKALVIALLNPKGLLFFPAVMVQFVDLSYDKTYLSFLLLAAIFQLCSLIYLNIMAPLAQHITHFFARYRAAGALGQSSIAGLFLLFAGKIWFASI